MNIITRKFMTIIALTLCVAFPAQLLAIQFIVNTTTDPDIVDPANCTVGSQSCSLREALAAADETAQHDTVVFNVDDPIFLTRKLTVVESVTIDGGGDTLIGIHQGYSIKTLPDRPAFGNVDLPVLQPTYFSFRGSSRAMLELFGPGSVLRNISIDGSIKPEPADLGVARIDFEGNDTTDFLLYTIDSDGDATGDRWLVAGGVLMTGSPTVTGSELRNFNANAVTVEFSFNAVITDNVISGGAAGQPAFSGDGISFFGSVVSDVSGNTVNGFRNGIVFNFSSGMDVLGNDLAENINGVALENVDTSFGENVIADNMVTDNLKLGIFVTSVAGAQIANNEVDANLEVGIHIKGAGGIVVTDNQVKHNGTNPTFHGGILINEGSAFVSVDSNEVSHNSGFGVVIDASHVNVVSNNEMKNNGGAGIVLLTGAQGNNIELNEITHNLLGVVAGVEFESLFPSLNSFQGNEIRINTLIDVLDFDPVCNDLWAGNTIDTVASASSNCIDQ